MVSRIIINPKTIKLINLYIVKNFSLGFIPHGNRKWNFKSDGSDTNIIPSVTIKDPNRRMINDLNMTAAIIVNTPMIYNK